MNSRDLPAAANQPNSAPPSEPEITGNPPRTPGARNAMTHTIPDMGTVALAVTDKMLHFELSGGTAP
jgi:hypothetical protein